MTKESYMERLKKLNPAKAVQIGRKHFSEKAYVEKVRKYGGRIGTKIVYYSLVLYYAFQNPNTPKKAKLTIAGALGYLILPTDVIPDFLPAIGFTDDSAVIIYALYQVLSQIDEPVKQQARERMVKIFGEGAEEIELPAPPK
ncbi:DUF1232 domain-containing protein [Halobacillus litoralis]|uniref:YkvA family protein n=1 Tax=Halobacillus litoralis TaxID=45668 RepID=UPI001CD530D5|nr:YkvA family protein [Halobacillus litoralis]MCA0972056.1 DUF1232 domain-containing protein [Halobacillus litoralis]